MYVSNNINVSRLQEGLCTKRFARNIVFSHAVGSTNDLAKELASYGAEEGTVVIAETQTAGHGRFDREWVSPQGGLWFSVILRPKLRVVDAARLVFAAGLAVAEVLHEMYDLQVETKWPNDVLINGRKICGILAEMNSAGEKVNFAVVGFGVNANFDVRRALPKSLRDAATSLWNELGHRVQLEDLFKELLAGFESKYDLTMKSDGSRILEKWKKYASFLGHSVGVTCGNEKLVGCALDVDSEGALVLGLEDGSVKRVFAGDVSMRSDCF